MYTSPHKSPELIAIEHLTGEFKGMSKRVDLLETQVAQQAAAISRTQGQLPGHPEQNPKEHVHVIVSTQKNESDAENRTANRAISSPIESTSTVDRADQRLLESITPPVVTRSSARPAIIETPDPDVPYVAPPPYVPPIPFPQRIVRAALDRKLGNFLELLHKIYDHLPCADILKEMPNYAK